MRFSASRLIIFGLSFCTLFWLAGPGGFETSKLLWLAIILTLTSWQINFRWPTILIFIGLVYLSLIASLSAGPATAWLGTIVNPIGVVGWWIIGGLAMVIINLNWSKDDLNWRTAAVTISSWLLIGLTILQQQNVWGINWTTFDDPNRGRELFGTIGSPAQLGVVAALLGSLLISKLNFDWRSFTNWTFIALVGLAIVSGSTTGIILIVLGITLRLTPKSWRLRLASLLSAAIVALTFFTAMCHPSLSRWPSLADRGAIWQAGWSAWIEKPLWGWGPNHFSLAYDHHYPTTLLDARNLSEERAHNLPLEALVETGLVGLLLISGSVYIISRRLWQTDEWLPLWLWLVASLFNPVIVPVAALGLLTLASPTDKVPTEPAPSGRWLAIACSLFLLYLAWGLVKTTITIDRASTYSSQLEFTAAANVAERTANRWPSHPQLILVAAEARTNAALKAGQWLESDREAELLELSRQQTVFFISSSIRAKIGQLWLKAGKDQPVFQQTQTDWQSWSDHPRFKEVQSN